MGKHLAALDKPEYVQSQHADDYIPSIFPKTLLNKSLIKASGLCALDRPSLPCSKVHHHRGYRLHHREDPDYVRLLRLPTFQNGELNKLCSL